MTRIVCRAMTCYHWAEGICTSEEIEYEPDVGCLTFQDLGDLELEAEDADDDYEWDDESSDSISDEDEREWNGNGNDWEV